MMIDAYNKNRNKALNESLFPVPCFRDVLRVADAFKTKEHAFSLSAKNTKSHLFSISEDLKLAFLNELKILNIQKRKLKERGKITASKEAKKLHSSLDNLSTQLFRNDISIYDFKKESTQAIKKARNVLEIHRGIKKIFINLELFCNKIGFKKAADFLHSTYAKHRGFFATTSAKIIDSIEKNIKPLGEEIKP